jgi:hypothetical protein
MMVRAPAFIFWKIVSLKLEVVLVSARVFLMSPSGILEKTGFGGSPGFAQAALVTVANVFRALDRTISSPH